MADFFSDIFDAFAGQQSAPQSTIINTSDLLGQTGGLLQSQIVPQTLAYNQALAPGLTDVQLGVERQYDPNAFALRSATSKSILDNLGLGTSLPPEIQDLVVRNALEGNAATGFGVSQGGRGLVARDLGLTGLDLARSRRSEAQGAVNAQESLGNLYSPQLPYGGSPGGALLSDIRDVQAQRDNYENMAEDIRKNNFSTLLRRGFEVAGFAGGMIASGGNPLAGAMGASIGGSVIKGSGVRGVNSGNPGVGGGIGGMFGNGGSILNGLFGGGRYSAGPGQQYAGANGDVMTSMLASPVNI